MPPGGGYLGYRTCETGLGRQFIPSNALPLNRMDGDLSIRIPVEPDERVLRAWPVEPSLPNGSADRGGWLVLTTHRVLFYRKPGLFGSG